MFNSIYIALIQIYGKYEKIKLMASRSFLCKQNSTSERLSQLFTRMASIIDIFNSVCVNNKPYRSFKNLTIGEHIIKNFYRVNAKIGVRIRIETSQSSLFLPEQFPWREDIDCICLKKSESGGSRPIESDFGY